MLSGSKKDFENHKEEMKYWFRKRDHPEDTINSEMRQDKFSKLKSNGHDYNMKNTPLVVTYHPLLQSFSVMIEKNLSLLCMSKDVKSVFTPRPMVAIHSALKLENYFVRAKKYPLQRIVVLYKCKSKRCQIGNNTTETDSFTCNND